eukprot:gene15302-21387_t
MSDDTMNPVDGLNHLSSLAPQARAEIYERLLSVRPLPLPQSSIDALADPQSVLTQILADAQACMRHACASSPVDHFKW